MGHFSHRGVELIPFGSSKGTFHASDLKTLGVTVQQHWLLPVSVLSHIQIKLPRYNMEPESTSSSRSRLPGSGLLSSIKEGFVDGELSWEELQAIEKRRRSILRRQGHNSFFRIVFFWDG